MVSLRGLWADGVAEPEVSVLVTPEWTPEGAPELAVDPRLLTEGTGGPRSVGLISTWAQSALHFPLDASIRVVVSDELPGLVGTSAARHLVVLHPLALSPDRCCTVDALDRRVLADAFIRSGFDSLARALARVPSSVADVVIDLLSHSGASAPALERFIGAAPLLERPDSELLSWATEEQLLRVVAGRQHSYRPSRAYDLLSARADLTLVPRIQEAYRSANSAEARCRLVLAHRAVAAKSYRVDTSTARNVIRRSTYEGRLADVDALIIELLRAARAGAKGKYRGVDLNAWSRAVLRQPRVVIVDHAVADGTTALELSARLRDAFPGPMPTVSVVGTDLAMDLFLVCRGNTTGVFDYDRRLLQVRVDGKCFHRSLWEQDVDLLRKERLALTAQFEGLSNEEEATARVRWISPAAAEVEACDPRRLSFEPHDIRQPYKQGVQLARAFGILYTGVRTDADSPTYFEATEAEHVLAAIAQTVVDGGLVLVGNVVDVEGHLAPHFDLEIRQVVRSRGDRKLRLCERSGAGLGIRDGPIPLPSGPHVSPIPRPGSERSHPTGHLIERSAVT